MRKFFRSFFNSFARGKQRNHPPLQNQITTSTGAVSAVLYAATISPPSIAGASPDESKELRHHAKHGKGFVNPWESWRDWSAPTILSALIMYVLRTMNRIRALLQFLFAPHQQISVIEAN
jgi:hypothetical protein